MWMCWVRYKYALHWEFRFFSVVYSSKHDAHLVSTRCFSLVIAQPPAEMRHGQPRSYIEKSGLHTGYGTAGMRRHGCEKVLHADNLGFLWSSDVMNLLSIRCSMLVIVQLQLESAAHEKVWILNFVPSSGHLLKNFFFLQPCCSAAVTWKCRVRKSEPWVKFWVFAPKRSLLLTMSIRYVSLDMIQLDLDSAGCVRKFLTRG